MCVCRVLSCVWLFVIPRTAAHQAPPSLGFSRQEYWSGLPFPSPMHESEKWNCSVVSDSSWPHGLQPTRLLCPGDFPGKSTGVGRHCLLHYSPWGATKGLWLCLITKLLLLGLFCFPLFLHFLPSLIKLIFWLKFFHRQKPGWGPGARVVRSYTVLLHSLSES